MFKTFINPLPEPLSNITFSIINLILAFTMADLLSGIFHWIEDSYITENNKWRLLMMIGENNKRHHIDPQEMTRCHWIKNMTSTVLIILPFVPITIIIEKYTNTSLYLIYLSMIFVSVANVIHRWSHMNTGVPRFIRILKYLKILQTNKHHRNHHKLASINPPIPGIAYCVMGNYLNPILDSLNIWRWLERIIYKITKIKPIHDI